MIFQITKTKKKVFTNFCLDVKVLYFLKKHFHINFNSLEHFVLVLEATGSSTVMLHCGEGVVGVLNQRDLADVKVVGRSFSGGLSAWRSAWRVLLQELLKPFFLEESILQPVKWLWPMLKILKYILKMSKPFKN